MNNSSHRSGSPGDSLFPSMVAKWLGINDRSLIADVGCGVAMSGLRIAQETGCRIAACDIDADALATLQDAILDLGLADNASLHEISYNDFVQYSLRRNQEYDLLLCEGGLFSYMGIKQSLEQARSVISESGHVLFSTLIYRDVSMSNRKQLQTAAPIPEDIVRFYANSPMTDGIREIMSDHQIDLAIVTSGFQRLASWALPASYWSDFYESISDRSNSQHANWRRKDDYLYMAATYETFFNMRGRHYIDYCYYLAGPKRVQ